MTDEQLLLEYRGTGNRDLFTELVYRYEHELFNYLRQYLKSSVLAEEVFQATFLKVHLKCRLFQNGKRFRPWLYAIATNQAIDTKRKNKRQPTVSVDQNFLNHKDNTLGRLADLLHSDEVDPLEQSLQNERHQIVRDSVQQLPEAMHAVVQLVYFQGMKYSEAAEVLSIPVGTVKSRLHIAVQKLAATLETVEFN